MRSTPIACSDQRSTRRTRHRVRFALLNLAADLENMAIRQCARKGAIAAWPYMRASVYVELAAASIPKKKTTP